MTDAQASQMITLLTALLGGMERLIDQTDQIRQELSDTGEQLAQLLSEEYVPDLANTQAQGRA